MREHDPRSELFAFLSKVLTILFSQGMGNQSCTTEFIKFVNNKEKRCRLYNRYRKIKVYYWILLLIFAYISINLDIFYYLRKILREREGKKLRLKIFNRQNLWRFFERKILIKKR